MKATTERALDMGTASDECKLIHRARRGDSVAFAEIYEQHQPAVFRYVYFRVADQDLAEELTSEVFVRMVAKIDGFSYTGRPILAWLYTIAHNLVIDHRRRAGRLAMLPLDEQLVATGQSPEVAAEQGLLRQHLSAALVQLTEDQRQVILLKFFEEMDNAEISQVLDKPVGAIKSLQHRALDGLRRALKR